MTISAVQSLYPGATDSTTSIASLLAQGAGGTASTGGTSTASATADISGPGRLMGKLQQLQQTDPAKFKQVMTDMAAKLSALAQQQGGGTTSASATDGSGAGSSQSLSDLAAKFTQAAQTGDLSAFQPPAAPSGTSAASAAAAYAQNSAAGASASGTSLSGASLSGHHHHHHAAAAATSSTDASSSADGASASTSQDPLAALFSQLNQSVSGALQTALGATTAPGTDSTDPTGLSPISNVYRLQKQVA